MTLRSVGVPGSVTSGFMPDAGAGSGRVAVAVQARSRTAHRVGADVHALRAQAARPLTPVPPSRRARPLGMELDKPGPVNARLAGDARSLEIEIGARTEVEPEAVRQVLELGCEAELLLRGRVVPAHLAMPDLSVQGGEACPDLLHLASSALPEDGLGPREVAADSAPLPPVDDWIEPDHDPTWAAAQLDELGKLGDPHLPRWGPRLDGASPETGHGEVGDHLVVPRKEAPHLAISEGEGRSLSTIGRGCGRPPVAGTRCAVRRTEEGSSLPPPLAQP